MEKYSEDQVLRYFKHVALPEATLKREPSLKLLADLQHHQITTVPFESLTLHYSKFHLLTIDPADVYKKVVERSMGGYCMELNTLFGTILRSLGFTVMATGGRVSQAYVGEAGDGYWGWYV
jgi:arylamine N-acetyltransferase